MNEASWASLGGLLVVAGGVIGTVLTAVYNYQSKRRTDSIGEWQVLLDKCNAECTRQGHVLEESQRAIEALREDSADCYAELGEVYVWMARYYDGCCERDDLMEQQTGHRPRPMPKPPQRRGRPERGDYLARTASQDAALVKAAAQPKGGAP